MELKLELLFLTASFIILVDQSPLDRGCLTESVNLMTTSPKMEYLLFLQLIF